MSFIEVLPTYESNKVKHPKRKEYLAAITQAILQSKSSMYFGVYFTGSTMIETGDWAVYDDSNNITTISYEDIMTVL